LALFGALELWCQGYDADRLGPMPRRLVELHYLLARDPAG
jgi:hypothetical protein